IRHLEPIRYFFTLIFYRRFIAWIRLVNLLEYGYVNILMCFRFLLSLILSLLALTWSLLSLILSKRLLAFRISICRNRLDYIHSVTQLNPFKHKNLILTYNRLEFLAIYN